MFLRSPIDGARLGLKLFSRCWWLTGCYSPSSSLLDQSSCRHDMAMHKASAQGVSFVDAVNICCNVKDEMSEAVDCLKHCLQCMTRTDNRQQLRNNDVFMRSGASGNRSP